MSNYVTQKIINLSLIIFLLILIYPNLEAQSTCDCFTPKDTLVNLTYNSATITWEPLPCADYYGIVYKWENGVDWTYIELNSSTNTFTLNNLQSCKKYKWMIRANCSYDNFNYWRANSFTTFNQNIYYQDNDGDSFGNPDSASNNCNLTPNYVLNNLDCNDSDININPNNNEICNNLDDDCDNLIDINDPSVQSLFAYIDSDGDGYGNNANSILTCQLTLNQVWNNEDCDDNDFNTCPNCTEICDNKDNNCENNIDEGLLIMAYKDIDNDGYGNSNESFQFCNLPVGYSIIGGDCDDYDNSVCPTCSEICDNKDNNCNNNIDEGVIIQYFQDADADAYGNALVSVMACSPSDNYVQNQLDCDDNNPNIYTNAPEICDNIDNNCNNLIDINDSTLVGFIAYMDYDGDGYGNQSIEICTLNQNQSWLSGDCDDNNINVCPNCNEVCDNKDNNCNNSIDEGIQIIYYLDNDNDGFGNIFVPITIFNCNPPSNYVTNHLDCNDFDEKINPNAQELCGGYDEDCDNLFDMDDLDIMAPKQYLDNDGDGYGKTNYFIKNCVLTTNYAWEKGDCNDANPTICPNCPELFDNKDNNCNGEIDECISQAHYRDIDNDGFGDPLFVIYGCDVVDGYVENNLDCDDFIDCINILNSEICDGLDNDCDGFIDAEDADIFQSNEIYYFDEDNDGYGNPNSYIATTDCNIPVGYINNNLDCNDNDASINPLAPEVLNNIDDDCDGFIDEDLENNAVNKPSHDILLDYTNTYNNHKLTVYPNPNNGIFNIQINNLINTYTLQITTISGKILFTKQLTLSSISSIEPIQLTNIDNGIYIISIIGADVTLTQRFIVLNANNN